MELIKWADSSECNGHNGDTCLNIDVVQKYADPGIIVRCVKRSHEKLFNTFDEIHQVYPWVDYRKSYQKNNTMSCETKDGKLLSTFSGNYMDLRQWAQGPDCSDGPITDEPDKECTTLDYIQNNAHKDIEIECIKNIRLEDPVYESIYACKHNGVILSTRNSNGNSNGLKRWAGGPQCQPIISFSTTKSTTTSTTASNPMCPELQAIQLAMKNESAKIKCIEDNGKTYKIGCYIYNKLVATKTGTIKQLQKWAVGRYCGQITCYCHEQFETNDSARCVAPNKWQCQKTTLITPCSGYTMNVFVGVKKNQKKKTPEAKKRHCENRVSECDPSGYVPNCAP